jgi:adenine phosphoribosyltransferase
VISITTGKPQLLVLDGFDVPKVRGHKVAIVDDVTSEEDAKAAAERVPQDYRALLVEAVQAYIAIGGAIPLEDAVPIVFKRCMEKGGA